VAIYLWDILCISRGSEGKVVSFLSRHTKGTAACGSKFQQHTGGNNPATDFRNSPWKQVLEANPNLLQVHWGTTGL